MTAIEVLERRKAAVKQDLMYEVECAKSEMELLRRKNKRIEELQSELFSLMDAISDLTEKQSTLSDSNAVYGDAVYGENKYTALEKRAE